MPLISRRRDYLPAAALLPITAACVIVSASLLGAAHDLAQPRNDADGYYGSLRILGYGPGDPLPPAAAYSTQWGWGTIGHYALEAARIYGAETDRFIHPPELAAGVVLLHGAAGGDEALRLRLPQETRDSLDGVDPAEIARGLEALRDALRSDIELYAMVPRELREGMLLALGYDTADPGCFPVDACLGGVSHQGTPDYESYLRGAWLLEGDDPRLDRFCAPASEELAAQFPWVVAGSMSWASFDLACGYWHTELLYRAILDRLPAAVSDRCRALVDGGWVVDSHGTFYHPNLGPADTARALDAGTGSAAARERIMGGDGTWRPLFLEECAPGYADAVLDSLRLQTGTPRAIPDVPGPTPWEGAVDLT